MASGFQVSFAACAIVLALAVVVTLGMQDLQLRSGPAAPRDIGH